MLLLKIAKIAVCAVLDLNLNKEKNKKVPSGSFILYVGEFSLTTCEKGVQE